MTLKDESHAKLIGRDNSARAHTLNMLNGSQAKARILVMFIRHVELAYGAQVPRRRDSWISTPVRFLLI